MADMDATDIVYISAEVIVGLITVIGNCLVLVAIVKTRRLHTITNVFVGNLAIADIAVGVLVAPCAALSFMGLPKNFYGCVFINCLILMFTNISILMLLAVAIERFIAIKEPFFYHRLLTVRRAVFINVCVWILGSVLGLMPMYGWHGGYRIVVYCRFTDMVTYEYMVYFQFFGLILLPLFLMLCIYIYILIIVRRHMRQTNALHNRFQQNNNIGSDVFNKDVRAAKMFALVILMFGIFWFPVNIFNCVSLFCGESCYFPKQALLAAIVMSHANSSINPFLYATSNSRIKGAIKGLFGIKLSPDERSSTDHNNARHINNGASRARENVTNLNYHQNNSTNSKDDIPSNSIFNDELNPGMTELSTSPKEQPQEGLNGVVPNHIKQTANNNNIKQCFSIDSYSHNASTHTSTVSLALLADTTKEKSPSLKHSSTNNHQHSSQNNDTNRQTFIHLPNFLSSPSSNSHRKNTTANHNDMGHPNLAFVDAETFSTMDEDCNHVTNCDKTDINKTQSFSRNHCPMKSGFLESLDNNEIIIKPAKIYRNFSNGSQFSARLNKIPETNKILESSGSGSNPNDVLMVRMFTNSVSPETAISTVSGHQIDSIENLELCLNSENNMRTGFEPHIEKHTTHNEKHTGHNAITSGTFTSSIFADQYGIIRNAKTEHTKL